MALCTAIRSRYVLLSLAVYLSFKLFNISNWLALVGSLRSIGKVKKSISGRFYLHGETSNKGA